MKLFQVSSGFVLHRQTEYAIDDEDLVGINDEGGVGYGMVDDKKEPQIFVADLPEMPIDARVDFGLWIARRKQLPPILASKVPNPERALYFGDVLVFYYDQPSRLLICNCNDDRSWSMPLISPKQAWEDKNPGPYGTLRVGGLYQCINPCSDLDFVYHDGHYLTSYPAMIDLTFPLNKTEHVKEHIRAKGFFVR